MSASAYSSHEQLLIEISIRNQVRFEGKNTFTFFRYFKDVVWIKSLFSEYLTMDQK